MIILGICHSCLSLEPPSTLEGHNNAEMVSHLPLLNLTARTLRKPCSVAYLSTVHQAVRADTKEASPLLFNSLALCCLASSSEFS